MWQAACALLPPSLVEARSQDSVQALAGDKRRRHLALIFSIALGGIGKLASHGLILPDRSPRPASQLFMKR